MKKLFSFVAVCTMMIMFFTGTVEASFGSIMSGITKGMKAYNKMLEHKNKKLSASLEAYDEGKKCLEAGSYGAAAECFRQAVDLDKKFTAAWVALGDVYYKHLDDMPSAIDSYKHAIELDKYSSYYNKLGNAYYNMDDNTNAIECYKEAISLDSKDSDYHSNLANAYTNVEDYPSSLESIKKAISLGKKDGAAYNRLAMCNYHLKNYVEALGAIDKALEVDPNKELYINNKKAFLSYEDCPGLFYNNLAVHYLDKEIDYDRALECAKKAVAANPNDAVFLRNCGMAYSRGKNDYNTAIEYLEKSVAVNNMYDSAYYDLAFCYDKISKSGEAMAAIDKAIAIKPDNEDYQNLKKELTEKYGNNK